MHTTPDPRILGLDAGPTREEAVAMILVTPRPHAAGQPSYIWRRQPMAAIAAGRI